MPLTTILDPATADADELAATYHQRWAEETSNDQLKTHLRGAGRILRSRLPDLVHQEIRAWLLVHYALTVLITRAAEAVDTDRISCTRTPRIVRRGATGTAAIPPEDWTSALPAIHAEITAVINRQRRHRTCPRAVKCGRHNFYRIKQRHEPASTRHAGPATIALYPIQPRTA